MTYYEFTYRAEKHGEKYAIREYKVYFYDDCIKYYQAMGLVYLPFDCDPILFDTEQEAFDYILTEL